MAQATAGKLDRSALVSAMTVRAQLAAMALPLAAARYPNDTPKFVADKAVEYADALIEALNG